MEAIKKTIVIIGGAGLLGTEFSRVLAFHDINVVIADYNLDAAILVCDELISEGIDRKNVIGLSVNIVDKDSILLLINKIIVFNY